ncbi:4'-phosphopantetheinyl transferase superfamily protein [Mucilaginibacter sp. HMF5004]|uniref:4'-phosphopantetheinyl transferase family protein n=1 Tax=Mucilaginibacter rivuli TaxID=2857527 RepID=UPI001C5E6B56|nr:4'-phosphopantetheinyl transferase superfamily protein [Mucilaginibacter rivuli]MBW4891623.1 4'-phosphopantetheinyl transferase superfamily protein [Mucilaginibacter rivuli]
MFVDLQLLSPHFYQHFTTTFNGDEVLTAREKALIEHSAEQRIKHFSTGRFCAKQALNKAGIADGEILVGESREPLWPEGIVGSISHSKQMAGAVVAATGKIFSVGLDIETIGGVRRDMWDMLFTPSEQQFLNSHADDELALYTTILFSGKEAFYKFQHPLTKTFLDFTDVEMSFVNGRFWLKVIKDFAGKEVLPTLTQIHFTKQNDQIITFCYHLNDRG